MSWRRFVAVGDSFTEGLDDPDPGGEGFRGWADLVAGVLDARAEDFRYANLAVRGRLLGRVVDEQVPLAAAMRPDLVSFAAGGNDLLRSNFDGPALIDRFEAVVRQFRAGGADVVLFRFADLSSRLPGQRLTGPRVALLNAAVREIADRHGARLVDLWGDTEFGNPVLWSRDRLHLSPAGHRRVAAHVLTALAVTPEPEWWETPGWPVPRSWWVTRGADAYWVGRHLAPWVKRRLTGSSSGDRITAKRPNLDPLRPPSLPNERSGRHLTDG